MHGRQGGEGGLFPKNGDNAHDAKQSGQRPAATRTARPAVDAERQQEADLRSWHGKTASIRPPMAAKTSQRLIGNTPWIGRNIPWNGKSIPWKQKSTPWIGQAKARASRNEALEPPKTARHAPFPVRFRGCGAGERLSGRNDSVLTARLPTP